MRYWLSLSIWLFLSTPSARRATLPRASRAAGRGISIHALREEGDGWAHLAGIKAEISIHALREEGDSMTSARQYNSKISIHALREEGDGQT